MQPRADIVTGYLPGVIGRVTELHARYYHEHWGFDAYFEIKIATEMSEFMSRYDAGRDHIWSARVHDRIEASVTIDGHQAHETGAHLRWFITSDQVRGAGLGNRLLALALEFCRAKAYPSVYLWTFSGLEPARHLYEKAGFQRVESRPGSQWGTRVEEQRFQVLLDVSR